jgi:amidophosphoribosyltransferase
MAEFIGADSLAFISIDGLYRALGEVRRDPAAPKFCDACFTGDYPIPLDDLMGTEDRQLSFLAETA